MTTLIFYLNVTTLSLAQLSPSLLFYKNLQKINIFDSLPILSALQPKPLAVHPLGKATIETGTLFIEWMPFANTSRVFVWYISRQSEGGRLC